MTSIQLIFIVVISLLIIFGIYKSGYNFIYFLPAFLIFFDVLGGWFSQGSGFGNLRNIFLFLLTFYIIIRNKGILYLNIWIPLFLIFTLFLIPMSSEPRNSAINYMVVWYTLFMYSIGFYFFKNLNQLRELNRFSIIMMVIFIGNAFVTASLGIGKNIYGGSLTLGGFLHARLYSGSVFLILLPLIIPLLQSKSNRILLFISSAVLYIILVLSMRRTAFLVPIIGYAIYFIFSKYKNRLILYGLVLVIIILGSYPLYKDIFLDQFMARMLTLEINLTEEYRYREIGIVWKETFSVLKTTMFGEEIYNSAGHYNNGLWGPRVLHTDFANILHGTGTIGVLLYCGIFASIAFSFLKLYRNNYRFDFLNELKAVFVALYIISIFIAIQGGMLTPTFRVMIFLYLGAILGIIRNFLENNISGNLTDQLVKS